MRVVDCEQGSPEWLQARCGLVTASRISDVLAKIKSGEAASRADYRDEIVVEVLTGVPQANFFTSREMRWGTEQEVFARAAYEAHHEVMCDRVGLVLHPTIEHAGASPDGLVGDLGLVEIKCGKSMTHLSYLRGGVVPPKHIPQMLWQLACCPGREWCDFVSYDPRLPPDLQLFCVRLMRDDVRIAAMEVEVQKFIDEAYQEAAELMGRR